MATTIHDLLEEVSVYTKISDETFKKAKASKITSTNNRTFKSLLVAWASGDYDESLELLIQNLENLL